MKSSSKSSHRFLSIAACISGFAVMGAEVAAGRLLAPSFGTSTLVWSALIGVVLGGLALGAMIGGRWSRRPFALRETFIANCAAGAMLVVLPAITRPLMRATLEQFLQGHIALLGLGFVGVLVALVVPVILLGATSPVLMHHATIDRADVGRTAGRLSALGTMGSLAGTFVCGVILVPLLGTEATFRVCGVLSIAVGMVGIILTASSAHKRRRSVIVAVTMLIVSTVALALLPKASIKKGAALFERETAMSYIRVVDDADHRTLYLNEGYAAQTIANHDGRSYLRGVWGYYAIAPAFTKAAPSRILVVGLGGGTSARDYKQRLPNAEVVAVEIDQGVVDVARTHFGLPSSVDVHVEDARTFLERDASTYDLIVIDAFQFPYVPFQLTTKEFFANVQRHLRDGGAVMVNVGRKGEHLDVVHAVASTLETVFPHVNGTLVRHATNCILVATNHDLDQAGGTRNVRFTNDEQFVLEELEPLKPWVVPSEARLVLTDDRAPVEWLTHRIVLQELSRMMRSAS